MNRPPWPAARPAQLLIGTEYSVPIRVQSRYLV